MSTIHTTLHFTLPEQFHDLLDKIAVPYRFEPHALLFRKGDPVQGLYLIQSGIVALRLTDLPDHPPRIIGPGALLGLPSTVGCRPYSLTAEAMEPVEAGFIARPEFMAVLQQRPDLCLALVHGLAWEITEARQHILQLIEGKAGQSSSRIA